MDGVAAVTQDGPEGSLLTIDVHPSGPCWVSLVADGQEVFAGVVSGSQRRVYEAREGFVISVGDAGLFDFSINQEPGRPLGSSGETVTVEITQENYLDFVRTLVCTRSCAAIPAHELLDGPAGLTPSFRVCGLRGWHTALL